MAGPCQKRQLNQESGWPDLMNALASMPPNIGAIRMELVFGVAAQKESPTTMVFDGVEWLVLDTGDSSVYNVSDCVMKMEEIEEVLAVYDKVGTDVIGSITYEDKVREYTTVEKRLIEVQNGPS